MADTTIDNESALEIEQASIALAADAALAAGDPLKFVATFATLGATRLGTIKGYIAGVNTGMGDQDGAVRRKRLALDRIEDYARAIYGYIGGLLPDTIPNPGGLLQVISESDRLRVYGGYGFAGGALGEFTDARRLALADLAIAAKPADWSPFWSVPSALVAAIASEKAVADTLDGLAGGGALGDLVDKRNTARNELAAWNGRVRAWVMHHSDLGEREPKLAIYGHPVRRDAGAAQVDPPQAVGAVTYNAVEKTLTVAALPAGARSLRAHLQPADGVPRLAGTSVTTTVNLAQLGPVETGVNYRAWLTGYSADGGEGAASNVVSFVG